MRFAEKFLCAAGLLAALSCSGENGTGPTPPPPPPPQPATASIIASDLEIELGQSTTISWVCKDATRYLIWSGPVSTATGTQEVTPTQAGEVRYQVTCDPQNGTVPATAFVSIKVTEKPKVVVQVYGAAPNGYGPTTDLRLVASSGNWKDSVNLSATGSGSIGLPSSVAASSEVCLSIREVGGNLYKDSNACLTASDALAGAKVFVLVPESWSIVSGTFAGESIPISLERATALSCDGNRFFMSSLTSSGAIREPLPTAIDRGSSFEEITPADSADWWTRINEARGRSGEHLFRPAMMGEVTTTHGVRIIINNEITGPNVLGKAGSGGSAAQGITYGFVVFRSKEDISRYPFLLEHELLHVAQYGHPGPLDWRGVLQTHACPGTTVTDHSTAEDIAYIQLRQKMDKVTRERGSHFDFHAAIAGEKGEFYRQSGSGLRSAENFITFVD